MVKTTAEDRRIKKTKKALKESLTKLLLEKKSLTDISVSELCNHADLSRGAFYLHYSDLYDLLEEIENDLLYDFSATLEHHEPVSLKDTPLPLIHDILAFVVANKEFCLVLIGLKVDASFTYKVRSLVREKCILDWTELYTTKQADKFEYYYSFIFAGCLELFITWLKGGMKESRESIAALAEQIMVTGVDVLK